MRPMKTFRLALGYVLYVPQALLGLILGPLKLVLFGLRFVDKTITIHAYYHGIVIPRRKLMGEVLNREPAWNPPTREAIEEVLKGPCPVCRRALTPDMRCECDLTGGLPHLRQDNCPPPQNVGLGGT